MNYSAVRAAKNPQLYFARRLNDAMQGAGTDEDTLIRIIVCRSEVSGSKINDCRINPTLISEIFLEKSNIDRSR